MSREKQYHPVNAKTLKAYNKIRDKKKRSVFCHAPFTSLFFTEYGEMLPCFYNKNIVFGHVSQDSPDEAWFGDKMNELRDHIKHNDLSFGCQDCKLYLDLGNYYSVGAWKYEYLPDYSGRFPISFDFQISNICNLSCIMCNGEFSKTVRQKREKKERYQNPYDHSFIKKIEPYFPSLKAATFTGGETLLIKQYYDIWDRMAVINPGIVVSISTNGTILNSRVKSYFEKLRFNITLSLDSVHKENFESIRRYAHFEKVMSNLDYFIEYTERKKTLFSVKICPMRQNWHELPDIINFLNGKNVSFLFNNVVFPPYCSLWNLPAPDLKNIYNFLKKQKFSYKTETQKANVERVNNLIKQVKNWYKAAVKREKLYPDVNQKTVEELYALIIRSVNAYLDKNSNISEKTEYGTQLEQVFKELVSRIEDREILKNAFVYFFQMPVHRLISEFNIRDIDRIVERTIQAGHLAPPPVQ